MPTTNLFAPLALLLIIPAVLIIFAKQRPVPAAAIALVAAVMFMPEVIGFDLPGIRPLGKWAITLWAIILADAIQRNGTLKRARVGRGVDLFLAVAVFSPIVSALLNSDSFVDGCQLHPLGLQDGIREGFNNFLKYVPAFIIGRAFFRTRSDIEQLLYVLILGAVLYLPFVAMESLRGGPYWNYKVYSYFQHDVSQTQRAGGTRPMVFFAHGLALALFYFMATASGWILLKTAKSRKRPAWLKPATVGLTVFFPMLHSTGALFFVVLFVPAFLLLRGRTLIRMAFVCVAILCAYPALKLGRVIPEDAIMDNIAQNMGKDRAGSLGTRLICEKKYFERAMERPWFGWGNSWGRNLAIYPNLKYPQYSCQDDCLLDGMWVIFLGCEGFVGYAGRMAMLLAPLIMLSRRAKRLDATQQKLLGGLSLMYGLCCVDLVPNSAWNYLTVVLAGVLAGLAQGMREQDTDPPLKQVVARLRLALENHVSRQRV